MSGNAQALGPEHEPWPLYMGSISCPGAGLRVTFANLYAKDITQSTTGCYLALDARWRLKWWTCAARQDVVYPVMNQRAMTYVGGGAQDAQAWLDFLGTVKDARTPPAGSPFQAGTQDCLSRFQFLVLTKDYHCMFLGLSGHPGGVPV